ncbi:MAG: 4Fe-4S dicluster domain-containing protein [Planctomycetota bacterium]|jgi:ferredoxin
MRSAKVDEQTLYQAAAGWLKSAVDTLQGAGVEVIAPIETDPGVVELAAVNSSEAVVSDYANVRLPLKQLFFPITEVLLKFESQPDGDVDVKSEPVAPPKEVVVIGARPCDVAALEALDRVFHWDYDDVRYSSRRERTTLITFACTKPSAQCFCTSVGGSPHSTAQSDVLVFLGADGQAHLLVCSDKGAKLIERLGEVVKPAQAGAALPTPPEVKSKFDSEKIKTWLDENFENDFWTDISLKCLGCGACSFLCPTCHCFDIVDEANWRSGQRRRNWDCCSHPMFTKHASGHNPRPDQASRCRQRVMHKFKYFPERFGQIACVGCGRCVRACCVGQNLVGILTDIETRAKGGNNSDAE